MTKEERDNLILSNRGIVGIIAKKAMGVPYIRKSLGSYEEVFQTGMVALCHAADKFDPTRLARSGLRKGKLIAFGSYAGRAIWNEITSSAQKCAQVGLPTSYGKSNTPVYILEKIEQATNIKQLDHLVACENIYDCRAADPLDILANKEIRKRILGRVSRLENRERVILRASFGIGTEEKALHAISQDLHITKQRVQQIREVAMEKLRKMRGWNSLL